MLATEPPEDDIAARIAFLKQRESELKRVVEEEQATAAATNVMLRLPQGVEAGKYYTAELPGGIKVRFMTPPGAVPGQLVKVKMPTAADQQAGDDEEEDEDE